MPKKRKDILAKDAQAKVKQRTDDLIDDADIELDYEETTIDQPESKADHRMMMRRRLENYFEERRLQKELNDDFDF